LGPRRLCVNEIRLRATTWRRAAARIIVERASDLLAVILAQKHRAGKEKEMSDFSTLVKQAKVKELLELHAAILEELRERNIVRSSNQPLGDYAELLFSRAFNWTLKNNSTSGHDAADASGLRVQIKGRRLTAHNASRQLSFIRRLPEKKFDCLAGVLFNADYSIRRAALVPHDLIEPRARFSQHANGWLFRLEDEVWALPGVRDVTGELTAAAAIYSGPQ
jgi:hypothetical protein